MTTDTTPDLRRLAAEMATHHRVFAASNDFSDTPEKDAADDAAFDRVEAAYRALIDTHATAPAGVLVKLEAAKAWGEFEGIEDTPFGDLIEGIMRDLRAMTA